MERDCRQKPRKENHKANEIGGDVAPNKHNRHARGIEAEKLATAYLEQIGYHIVDMNWRCRSGEIDMVAREDDVWVFIEVRSRIAGSGYGEAAEAIDWRKQRQVRSVATAYIHFHRLGEVRVRFDAVTVTYLSDLGAPPEIKLYQGAF